MFYVPIMVEQEDIEAIGTVEFTDKEVERLVLLREAVRTKSRLQIRYKKHLRVILVHRVWLQDDGSILVEALQQGGGSAWARIDGRGGGFVPSPLGGWLGWVHVEFEYIESIALIGGSFRTPHDFNPNPKKRLGRVVWQVQD